ncbi:MAG TPA: cysteine--tRNA ligase [Acholeplasmataceae bacterium]|nr:cysteine--tRNA ligase [Acholeplasmataceae bacterium]
MKIYNTLTKKNEIFTPINKNEITMYVCGPTVYSDIHIGNARPVIFFDLLRNYLLYRGYNVKYVSNITDIDDKIIDEAKKKNITEEALTNIYTKAFIDATKKVGSKLPDLMPKATNYIDGILENTETLIEKGFAYKTDSGVYFNVSKLDDYGILSKQDQNMLEDSVRIENVADKKDFRDFTLWKKTYEGLSYDSKFGRGRPGWHSECAVMNSDIFNGPIDIHGGGSDLIFPHHENEIAITKATHNHGLANYWMHVGRVDMSNEKMSKSLGNTILVKDLENPISYRLLIINHHYRSPINYSETLMDEMHQMYDRIKRTLMRTALRLGLNNHNELDDEIMTKFNEHMANDFNTPNVITEILQEIKNLNKELDEFKAIKIYNSIRKILEVLSLLPNYELTNEVLNDYNNWEKARNEKNYELADNLRGKLAKEGWI